MESTDRQVNIKTISGEVKSLSVPCSISILDFKQKVSQLFNVPVDKQRLICSGKLLKDEQNLNDHIKEDGQTVHLMVRADQPAGSQPEPQRPQPSPQPANQQMPFQLDRLLSSMGQIIPGMQYVAGAQGLPGALHFNLGQVITGQNQPGPFPPAQSVPVFGAGSPSGSSVSSVNVTTSAHSAPASSRPPAQSGPAGASEVPNNQNMSPGHRAQPHGHVHQGVHRNVEVSLPFDRVHNIGSIVNELHGGSASFPPPRMPLLPFQRNPMTLLGGFLHNYEFQLLRFLPFISRASDLLQRESLMTDPNDRAQLQALVQRVAAGLNEITAATAPVAAMLSQLQIGQAPGQFNLRMGNLNISQEVRAGGSQPAPQVVPNPSASTNIPTSSNPSSPANPVNPSNALNPSSPMNPANPMNPSAPPPSGAGLDQANPLSGLLSSLFQGGFPGGLPGMVGLPPGPSQGVVQNDGNPFAMMMQGGAPNLFSMMPMFSQILGGNNGMTLRDMINSLQMHDEEESLPMMDFFYNLRIPEVMSLASGNWEPIEQQRPAVRENLIRLMEGDSPEGRQRIVQILLDYIQRQYAVPAEFVDRMTPGFDPQAQIVRISEKWLRNLVDHVMDYSGNAFVPEFKRMLLLLIGNYTFDMSQNLQGGMATVQLMVQAQMSTALGRIIPPEFVGLIQGFMEGLMNSYLSSSNSLYQDYLSTNRVQEEAKDSQSPAGSLLATWQETIERDQKIGIRPQPPFSRSYLSSDLFSQGSSNTPELQSIFITTLNSSVTEAGASLDAQNVPSEVVQEFIRNWSLGVRERIRNDSDFRSGRFEALDRLRK